MVSSIDPQMTYVVDGDCTSALPAHRPNITVRRDPRHILKVPYRAQQLARAPPSPSGASGAQIGFTGEDHVPGRSGRDTYWASIDTPGYTSLWPFRD
jgi:hypothetical protein